jgi:hypothetical protein
MQTYADELVSITQSFDDEMTALGEKVRAELVLPACRKHKLRFSSGNGDYFFAKGDARYGGVNAAWHPKLSMAAQSTLKPIMDLLDQEVSHGQHLGYFVVDVECA